MSEKQPPKSAAERKRAQRQRMRERGEPPIPAFDSALREAVFSSYQSGELTIDVPDLVRSVVERLSAAGSGSERGCRATVRTLLAKAGGRANAQV